MVYEPMTQLIRWLFPRGYLLTSPILGNAGNKKGRYATYFGDPGDVDQM